MLDACPTSCSPPSSPLSSASHVARSISPFQSRSNRGRKPSASLSLSPLPPTARKTMVPFADKARSSSTLSRSILLSPCRANILLTPSRFVRPIIGNAVVPTEVPGHAPSAAARRLLLFRLPWTTSSRVVAPPTSPLGPLQKPPRIPTKVTVSMEIGIVFSSSGRRTPSSIPSSPNTQQTSSLELRHAAMELRRPCASAGTPNLLQYHDFDVTEYKEPEPEIKCGFSQ